MMTTSSDLIDTDTANVVGVDDTVDAAPAIGRRAHGQHGRRGIARPAPGGELPRSASVLPRRGVGSAVTGSAP
ncbi:MAG: hypothetical protein AVDCRST_MAG19-4351 [uncultured Thermomicrobiales bacterium]|uniref:Uncharacterized protein n=1 Tax=uncultured Thermomicrobiales bacterium TaxID=1645740 RepID=A0A6J4VN57_9BACT|nr:MAG: hypothetical protein AVDCRST_MAG19-4351 [uncultured Thermomicrobiales bacterium]